MCTTAVQQLTRSPPSVLQSRALAGETWFAPVSVAGKGCGGDALLVPCLRSSLPAGFLPPRIHADAANHKMPQAEVTCQESMVWHFQWTKSPMASEAMLLNQPVAPQSGEDLTIRITQAGSEGDKQQSQEERK